MDDPQSETMEVDPPELGSTVKESNDVSSKADTCEMDSDKVNQKLNVECSDVNDIAVKEKDTEKLENSERNLPKSPGSSSNVQQNECEKNSGSGEKTGDEASNGKGGTDDNSSKNLNTTDKSKVNSCASKLDGSSGEAENGDDEETPMESDETQLLSKKDKDVEKNASKDGDNDEMQMELDDQQPLTNKDKPSSSKEGDSSSTSEDRPTSDKEGESSACKDDRPMPASEKEDDSLGNTDVSADSAASDKVGTETAEEPDVVDTSIAQGSDKGEASAAEEPDKDRISTTEDPDKDETSTTEEPDKVGTSTSEENKEKDEDAEMLKTNKEEDGEIVEIPVHKKPAEVVDLEEEDDGEKETGLAEKGSGSEDGGAESTAKGLKLRSLASLVDTSENKATDADKNESVLAHTGAVLPNPEAIGAVGEIVEHKDLFCDRDSGGLPLRISNVVGGEDCITGLAMDDDRDMLSAIQISSVTTLMDPISPEDPNKDKDGADIEGQDGDMDKADSANLESSEYSGIKIVSAESLASKQNDGDKSQDQTGPKIRLSSAVSEVAKDTGDKETSPSNVYHILRSILTMSRDCIICGKKVRCEFRITKKNQPGTYAFLCTSECRVKFAANLRADEVIEKPRLIFEKICGQCHKDLTSLPRSGQYSWETREFCSEKCLTTHLQDVAGRCHMCKEVVRAMYIGKYCVRFGSDVHQFCSNHCLERYKTKIKVCCYCQKNVEHVLKVTSPAYKEYCSMKCLKRAQRRDIGQQNYNEQHPCTVCQTQGFNRYEFLVNEEAQQLCSDPCLNVFKYVNKVKAVTCCLCFRVLNAEDVSQYLYHGGHQLRVFCSDSCVNVFILSARKIVICDTCKVKKYNFDMVHRQVDEDFKEYYYCSLHCLKNRDTGSGSGKSSTATTTATTGSTSTVASGNISTSSGSDAPIAVCSMCSTVAKAQFHMVMSDNTLRSFCRYSCASRYKNTFGYLVDGQSKEPGQAKSSTAPAIRPKPTSQLTTTSTSTVGTQPSKPMNAGLSQEALQATTELLKLLSPPNVANKTTMCKPSTCTKGVYCKPHPWHRQTQTDIAGIDSNLSEKELPPILPVPVPCYVPSPMCMYNVPCPVPIFVPIPLPVPIFLPTTAKTSKDVMNMMKKIQEEIPTDPIQAEMLLLARQSIEQEVHSEEDNEEPAEETGSPVDNFTSYSGDDEAVNDEAINDELNSADEACLNTMEEDLPRYPLRETDITSNYSESEVNNEKKRKKRGRGRPKKRARRDSDDDSQSMSDPEDMEDPDFLPEPETILEEEFQGPFLNKMYGLTAWKSWVTKKNAELAGVSSSRSMKLISEDLLTMNCDELNYALCLFLKDLRKPNGEVYQPDTILYLLLGIQQHLFESSRTDCIFMDFGFEKFTNSLDEITRTFWVSPTLPGVSPMITLGVTRITEAMLWECRQLGAHTPQVLLNTLFYFNTKVFKLKTVDDHLAMSFVQIVKQWRRSTMGRDGSGTRTTLLKYYPKKSNVDGDKPRPNYEMHENRDDPLRCPVKLYEFYLSKCPESVRNQRNVYYVYPERSCVPDSPVWFSTQAVHASSIAKMLNRALMVREVQEAFSQETFVE